MGTRNDRESSTNAPRVVEHATLRKEQPTQTRPPSPVTNSKVATSASSHVALDSYTIRAQTSIHSASIFFGQRQLRRQWYRNTAPTQALREDVSLLIDEYLSSCLATKNLPLLSSTTYTSRALQALCSKAKTLLKVATDAKGIASDGLPCCILLKNPVIMKSMQQGYMFDLRPD